VETLLRYGLVAVYVALVLTAVGLPIPEDLSLLVAGALARTGNAALPEAILVGYVGVLTGDCIVWTLGRRTGLNPKSGWLGRLFGPEKTARMQRFYDRMGPWTVVVCRQLPGLRFPAFFFAGATGMSLRRFLLLDGLAAIITVSVWEGVGWWLGDRLAANLRAISNVRYVMLTLGAVLAAFVVGRWMGARKERKKQSEEPPLA